MTTLGTAARRRARLGAVAAVADDPLQSSQGPADFEGRPRGHVERAVGSKAADAKADAIAMEDRRVSIPPTKSLEDGQLAGCAEALLDSDAPYEAPTGEDGGETDEVPPHSLRVRRRRGPKTVRRRSRTWPGIPASGCALYQT